MADDCKEQRSAEAALHAKHVNADKLAAHGPAIHARDIVLFKLAAEVGNELPMPFGFTVNGARFKLGDAEAFSAKIPEWEMSDLLKGFHCVTGQDDEITLVMSLEDLRKLGAWMTSKAKTAN